MCVQLDHSLDADHDDRRLLSSCLKDSFQQSHCTRGNAVFCSSSSLLLCCQCVYDDIYSSSAFLEPSLGPSPPQQQSLNYDAAEQWA